MKLKEGAIMDNKALAEWFGIKPDSIRSGNAKQKKLEELKEYCDFEINKSRVIIKKVYEDTYVKSKSKIYKIILKDLPNRIENNKPWTSVQMGDYYYCKHGDDLAGKLETYVDNTRKARNNIWGEPKKGSNIIYTHCKMYRGISPKDNRYELFTEEERKIFSEVYSKYFKVLNAEESSHYLKYDDEENALSYYKDMVGYKEDKYLEFIVELTHILNCDWIVRATIVEDINRRIE